MFGACWLPAGAESSVEDIGRLALLHSTQRRFSRTHMNTVNMSLEVRCLSLCTKLCTTTAAGLNESKKFP
jgi:hypothetical protein